MSALMKLDKPVEEEVALDLTAKKEEICAVSEPVPEYDDSGKLTEDAQLVPLDLSARRALPLQPPPSPLPQCNVYWTPHSWSPMIATEQLTPLPGGLADVSAHRRMISSAAVPEYNPFLPVLPMSTDTQFQQHDHIQHQLQHLHMQQQHQLHKLQLQVAYGGIPLDAALVLSGRPVHTATSSSTLSESNHLPFSGFDCSFSKPAYGLDYHNYDRMLDGRVTGGAHGCVDTSGNQSDCPSAELTTTRTTTTGDHHHQLQQQWDLDREQRHRIEACLMDDLGVVDPEEVAAIYRQSDFLWFRYRYMERLGRSRNCEKMRRSRNNSNSNHDDHWLTPGQQMNDQTHVLKRQKINEAAKRWREAKRQKYIENQISVMYLTNKVSEMKDIKRRLLKDNSDILAE